MTGRKVDSTALISRLVQAHGICMPKARATAPSVTSRRGPMPDSGLSARIFAFDEIQGEEDFQLLSFSGDRLKGEGPIHSEWPIYAGVFAKRPEIGSVIHTHSSSAALISACDRTIEPLTTDGGYFFRNRRFLFTARRRPTLTICRRRRRWRSRSARSLRFLYAIMGL